MSLAARPKPWSILRFPFVSQPHTERSPSWDATASRWQPWAVLTLLCGALFFYGLNVGEFYRTEALRAIIAQEILNSGNWIVPTLYEQPLLTKPPGMYAAIAAASAPLGHVTEWTARLPSALAATALVFLFYWHVSRQLGRLAGLAVAAVVPCGFLWLDKAGSAEIDLLQVAWVGAALLYFFTAVERCEAHGDAEPDAKNRPVGSFSYWLLALLCVAGGVLTKWTAPVFFYSAAIPFLLWRRQLRLLWSWQHLLAAGVGASLCFAWVGAVMWLVGWDVFAETVWQEAAPRILHHEHRQSWSAQALETLVHPFKLLFANLPWSGFALFTLIPGFLSLWDERGRRLVQALHCWTWPSLLVWTILPDHATRHAFPLFPGLVALGAMTWVAFITGRLPERWARWHVGFTLLSFLGFAGFAVGLGVFGVLKLPSTAWWLVILVLVMAGWCVSEAVRALRSHRLGWLLACCVLTWVILRFAFVHLYIPVRNHGREPREKAAVLAEHVPAGETLYLFFAKDEGIMFYYSRSVVRLPHWNQLPQRDAPVYCIVTEDEWRQLQKDDDWEIQSEVHLRDEQGDSMVLLGLLRARPTHGDAWARSERCCLPTPKS